MLSNKLKIGLWITIGLLIGWSMSYLYHTKNIKIEDKQPNQHESHQGYKTRQISANTETQEREVSSAGIPGYALEVLEYIRENKEAPNGYVGGRVFQNREGLLPKSSSSGAKIRYQEWDVHPRQEGKNRGAERLVTSDEEAYFTSDHYRSFQKIQ